MLEYRDDELGVLLQKQRRVALHGHLSCGGSGSSGAGEENSDFVREGGSTCGLLGADVPRSGRALAGGGAESGEGGVGHVELSSSCTIVISPLRCCACEQCVCYL
jgi:hypothetical protein